MDLGVRRSWEVMSTEIASGSPSPHAVVEVEEISGGAGLAAELADIPPMVIKSQSEAEPQELASEKFSDMSYARVGLILSSLGLCTFLFAIEQTIVSTAVSDIGEGVMATGSLAWITTSYLLTTTVIQPITGRLSVSILVPLTRAA